MFFAVKYTQMKELFGSSRFVCGTESTEYVNTKFLQAKRFNKFNT